MNKRATGAETPVPPTETDLEAGLPWWHRLVTSALHTPVIDHDRMVFTNRTLRMEKIRAVGFDLDHTLAVYNCPALDNLAMKLVIDRLIAEEGIPAEHFDKLPDPAFARKGLALDIELGNVLKVDRHGHVSIAYHGTQRLTSEDKRRQYGDLGVIPNVTQGDRFVQVDSAFAKPEVLIYAGVAPHLGSKERRPLWKKIRHHTDTVHSDGSLKQVICRSPLDFLVPDVDTLSVLRHLKEGGKKVFLLTNSEWEYTQHIAGPALGLIEDGSPDWRQLFDLVVVEARKPGFFRPRNKKSAVAEEVSERVVRGGTIEDLEARLGFSGSDVLYVGDHIYSDLISSKRQTNWRTMLIIAELEEELRAQSLLPGVVEQLKQTDERRTRTDSEVQYWKALEASLDGLQDPQYGSLVEHFKEECADKREQATLALGRFIHERETLRTKIATATNHYWGSLFRSGSELTYYGRQLEDFACTYTSRATNLLLYPMDHYFRSAMDYLPHELESM